MAKFRKKPVAVEAVRWTGKNFGEIEEFSKGMVRRYFAYEKNEAIETDYLEIPTTSGDVLASVDDWIVKGIKGEFYPCKPDIFEQTYERAEP